MLNLSATAQGVQKIYIVGNHNNLKFRNEVENFEHKNKKKSANFAQKRILELIYEEKNLFTPIPSRKGIFFITGPW